MIANIATAIIKPISNSCFHDRQHSYPKAFRHCHSYAINSAFDSITLDMATSYFLWTVASLQMIRESRLAHSAVMYVNPDPYLLQPEVEIQFGVPFSGICRMSLSGETDLSILLVASIKN